ncbi:germination protein YpeB [Tissierella sp. Yu-01]|uniref:germination protein YpeB n=1 Tax=Tissierella sp. Yu-01 TaxID=3035694 RepID=UPI00240E1058|nr:germination protein YpeB [Tissierella sp. Yu-01]WFA08519.1 germination protein YpeB [Tissierella sp. Yu-01]
MSDRKSWIAPSVLSLLLIASLVWGYNQYASRQQYEVTLDNHYQRLFFDVSDHVNKVSTSLNKALVATTPERNILLFTQIMSDASQAKDKLAQMPISHSEVSATEKFLTQAADYSYFIIQRHLEGQDITPEQRDQIKNIQLNTAQFNSELNNVANSIQEENFLVGMANAGRQNKDNETASTNALVTSLTNYDKEVAKTPELIYDGPFADQMLNKKPVGLPNGQVNLNQARDIAIKFIGQDKISDIEAFEEGQNMNDARIPVYSFQALSSRNRDQTMYISVSKQGGAVLNMTNPRGVSQKKLSVNEGQQKALEFLESKGFRNMEPNYNLRYDGTVLYNFVYSEDGVTVYPDLVKVKVALDTGDIVGFDAAAYYLNHQDNRDFGNIKISENEAARQLRNGFQVTSSRLAMIPKGKIEVICYEFKGTYDDGQYIIYINAETGQEEQLLQIIQNENGTFTF